MPGCAGAFPARPESLVYRALRRSKRTATTMKPPTTIGDEVAIAREGLVSVLVGQRPFEMGYKAPSVMINLIDGKKVDDPVFAGLDECTKDTVDTCIQK